MIDDAITIFKQIESDKYDVQEKGQAIYDVLQMTTLNIVTKADMLKVIDYLLRLYFDIPEEVE